MIQFCLIAANFLITKQFLTYIIANYADCVTTVTSAISILQAF